MPITYGGFLNFSCHTTFHVLHYLFPVFLEDEVVSVVVEPQVSVDIVVAFVVAEPQASSVVAEPGVAFVVEPQVSVDIVVAFVAAEPQAPSFVAAEPGVAFVAAESQAPSVVAEPGVSFVVEPQVSVDIVVASVALVPFSVVVAEVDNS